MASTVKVPGAAVSPLPWIAWIRVIPTSSLTIVPMPWPSPMAAPVTFVTFTRKVSSGSTVASPLTVTSNALVDSPTGIVWPVRPFAT